MCPWIAARPHFRAREQGYADDRDAQDIEVRSEAYLGLRSDRESLDRGFSRLSCMIGGNPRVGAHGPTADLARPRPISRRRAAGRHRAGRGRGSSRRGADHGSTRIVTDRGPSAGRAGARGGSGRIGTGIGRIAGFAVRGFRRASRVTSSRRRPASAGAIPGGSHRPRRTSPPIGSTISSAGVWPSGRMVFV